MRFKVEVLDTWNMTITPIDGVFKIVADGTYRYHAHELKKIRLPGNPHMAIRIRRLEGDTVQFSGSEKLYGE
jgi:hypothetical protein